MLTRMEPAAISVEHETGRQRFVVHFPEGEGELVYRRIAPRTLDLVHTEVDPLLRRRGIGDALVRAALEYARQQKLRIIPTCHRSSSAGWRNTRSSVTW